MTSYDLPFYLLKKFFFDLKYLIARVKKNRYICIRNSMSEHSYKVTKLIPT
jgi:hypothetical protein